MRRIFLIIAYITVVFFAVAQDHIENEEFYFSMVAQKPTFMGCDLYSTGDGDVSLFAKWVNENLVYPEVAKENGIQGTVTLLFTVDTNGYVTDVKGLKHLSQGNYITKDGLVFLGYDVFKKKSRNQMERIGFVRIMDDFLHLRLWEHKIRDLFFDSISDASNYCKKHHCVLVEYFEDLRDYVADESDYGLGFGYLYQEAIRVVASSPKWEPGEHDGTKVNTLCVLSVNFRLN